MPSYFRKLWGIEQSILTKVRFNPLTLTFATASLDGSVALWNINSDKGIKIFPHCKSVFDIAWSPNGELMASVCEDCSVKLWNPASQDLLWIGRHEGAALSVTFSPGGTLLSSVSMDESVKIWDVEKSKVFATYLTHSDAVVHTTFSTDGKYISNCSNDRKVSVFDPRSGIAALELAYNVQLQAFPLRLEWFKETDYCFVVGDNRGDIRLFDTRSVAEVKKFSPFKGVPVSDIVIDPDDRRLYACSQGHPSMYMYDFEKSQHEYFSSLGLLDGTSSIDLSFDGNLIVACGSGNQVRLFKSEITLSEGNVKITEMYSRHMNILKAQRKQEFLDQCYELFGDESNDSTNSIDDMSEIEANFSAMKTFDTLYDTMKKCDWSDHASFDSTFEDFLSNDSSSTSQLSD